RVGKGVETHLIRDLAQQHRKSVRRIGAQHLRPAGKRGRHAPRHVDEQDSPPRQLLASLDRAEHCALQRLLPLRRIACRGKKPEREYAVRLHDRQRVEHEFLANARVLHIAKVAEQRECSELALAEQPLPASPLVATGGERHLPGVGRGQLSVDQALPQCSLSRVARTSVAEKKHIPQTNRAGAIVLRQSVLIELRERSRQALLHLSTQRSASLGPIDGHELGQLIRTLDHAGKGIRYQTAMRRMARHFANQIQRRVTQLHRLARLDSQSRHLRSLHLRRQLANPPRDLHSILVELALSQQAGQHAAPQCLLVGDPLCRRSLMGARRQMRQLHNIQTCHWSLLSLLRRGIFDNSCYANCTTETCNSAAGFEPASLPWKYLLSAPP